MMAFSTASRVSPVRCWMRRTNSSYSQLTCGRSSIVSSIHLCFSLRLVMVQLSAISRVFILLFGFLFMPPTDAMKRTGDDCGLRVKYFPFRRIRSRRASRLHVEELFQSPLKPLPDILHPLHARLSHISFFNGLMSAFSFCHKIRNARIPCHGVFPYGR